MTPEREVTSPQAPSESVGKPRFSGAVLAGVWMMGAMISFTVMAIGGRALAGQLDTFEIMFYRSLLGIIIVLGVAHYAGSLGQISSQRLSLHMIRNVCHFIGQNLWFYAVALIPLSQLFAFEFTTPLWVAVLAPLVLGEKWTVTRVSTGLIGFVGILIVARPDLSELNSATIAAALCALGFAGAALSTKRLSSTESVTCILFWLVILQALFGLICAGYDGAIRLPDAGNWYWVVLVGLCGLSAHFCITNALSIAPATVVTPMEFLRLPLISLVAYWLYDEPLLLSVFAGAVVILVANVINVSAQVKLDREAGS